MDEVWRRKSRHSKRRWSGNAGSTPRKGTPKRAAWTVVPCQLTFLPIRKHSPWLLRDVFRFFIRVSLFLRSYDRTMTSNQDMATKRCSAHGRHGGEDLSSSSSFLFPLHRDGQTDDFWRHFFEHGNRMMMGNSRSNGQMFDHHANTMANALRWCWHSTASTTITFRHVHVAKVSQSDTQKRQTRS